MSRSKYDPEQKIKIVQSYLDGISSVVSQLAETYGLGKTSIKCVRRRGTTAGPLKSDTQTAENSHLCRCSDS